MISHTAEYALRAAVCLAAAGGDRVPTHVIASETGVPPGYLPKVLVALSSAGVACARKGPAGGYRLTRPPEDISLLEVARAADRILAVPDWAGHPGSPRGCSRLQAFLDQTQSGIEAALAGVMLSDMVDSATNDKRI